MHVCTHIILYAHHHGVHHHYYIDVHCDVGVSQFDRTLALTRQGLYCPLYRRCTGTQLYHLLSLVLFRIITYIGLIKGQ